MTFSVMRTSAIVVMIVGLGMTAAPEIVYPDGGAAFAQGKSGERGNGGNRGRSGRGDDTEFSSRGHGGNKGNRGGKSDDWVPPGQAKWAEDGDDTRGGKGKKDRFADTDDVEDIDGIETELEDSPKGRGRIASALGALNAAHASENALANASPNSRVGRIAAYRDEVLNGQAAEEELEAARTLLKSLKDPEVPAEDLAEPLTDEEKQAVQNVIDGKTESLEGFSKDQQAYYDALAYEEADKAVKDLEDEVADSEELQMELLEDAANKEITDEVIVEVNRLLGIEDTEEVVESTTLEEGGDEELLPEG